MTKGNLAALPERRRRCCRPAAPAHVPTADPSNAFAALHTREALLKEWDRRQAAWQKEDRNDPAVRAAIQRLEAQRDAREAEVHAAHGGNASPPPPPPAR